MTGLGAAPSSTRQTSPAAAQDDPDAAPDVQIGEHPFDHVTHGDWEPSLAVEARDGPDAVADDEHLELALGRTEGGDALVLLEGGVRREGDELLAVELEQRAGTPHEHALGRAADAVPPRPPVRRAVQGVRASVATREPDRRAAERETPHRAVGSHVELVQGLLERVRGGDLPFDDVQEQARRAIAPGGRTAEQIEVVRRRPARRAERVLGGREHGQLDHAAKDQRRLAPRLP